MEYTYKKLETHKDNYDEFIKYDVLFNTIIASASKNSVIVIITYILYNIVRHTMCEDVEYAGVEKGYYYHSRLLEAIKNRDLVMAKTL